MTTIRPEDKRDVIPRWRDSRATLLQGELGPVRRREGNGYERDYASLQGLEKAWRENETVSFANDLVGSALVVGTTPRAREAAEFVLAQKESGPLARAVSLRLLAPENEQGEPTSPVPDEPPDVRQRIHDMRVRLRRDPRNTLVWVGLARYYTTAGHPEKASHAMRIALGLSPDHRFVLRAASRLAIHQDEYDRAHQLISRAPATRHDPWLVATELATAEVAGRRSRLIRHGREMLASQNFLPLATSELAAALGTIELRAGDRRAARQLFEQSLKTPNENSIAQAEWASHLVQGIQLHQEAISVSPEALAHAHSQAGEWEESTKAAWAWLNDQPFSARPAELGSYEASLGQNYVAGIAFARAGLQANPHEALLLNNLIFCLIHTGELPEAEERLASVQVEKVSRDEQGTLLATAGLLAFRQGDPETGRARYYRAIEMLRGKARIVATILLAREELRAHLPGGEETASRALALGESEDHPDIELWLQHLPQD